MRNGFWDVLLPGEPIWAAFLTPVPSEPVCQVCLQSSETPLCPKCRCSYWLNDINHRIQDAYLTPLMEDRLPTLQLDDLDPMLVVIQILINTGEGDLEVAQRRLNNLHQLLDLLKGRA